MQSLRRRRRAALVEHGPQHHEQVEVEPPGLAEDVVQESLLRGHLARDRFRGGEPGRARDSLVRWCLGIARNTAIDGVRGEQRHHRRRVVQAIEPAGPHPESEWMDAERGHDERRRLRAAIATLPPGAREVVTLHRLDGLSMAEIAAQLGLRPGTVRVRAH
ncbi:MAG: RNA polymerase sigma factor, partial [Myxococcales bacterium]|nr:RNA polymerase sigma factor [Myxococcales bacterium]